MNKSGRLVLKQIASELLVNLAAGWYGAAVIVPTTSENPQVLNFGILTANIIFGTVFIVMAYKLRRLTNNRLH